MIPLFSRPAQLLVGGLLLSTAASCGTIRPGVVRQARAEGTVITAEQIERSQAKTAWEAIRRSGTHLLIRQNATGDQARVTHRGVNSFFISGEVLVIVDEVPMADWTYLREIPARTISYIQILSGPAGTIRYGTGAGNGVVVVKTGVPVS